MKSSREGINAFLEGYLKEENVRFRDHALKFQKIADESRVNNRKMIGWNTCLAEFKRLNLDVEERKKVKWPEKAFCKEHPENDHTCVECAINRRGNTMIFACIQAHNEAMKE